MEVNALGSGGCQASDRDKPPRRRHPLGGYGGEEEGGARSRGVRGRAPPGGAALHRLLDQAAQVGTVLEGRQEALPPGVEPPAEPLRRLVERGRGRLLRGLHALVVHLRTDERLHPPEEPLDRLPTVSVRIEERERLRGLQGGRERRARPVERRDDPPAAYLLLLFLAARGSPLLRLGLGPPQPRDAEGQAETPKEPGRRRKNPRQAYVGDTGA
mgnify:CR=1 FL=1